VNREQARAYVAYCVDDSCNQCKVSEIPDPDTRVRYVVFSAGFELVTVAVWSYLPNCRVDDEEAIELAQGLLHELGWFANPLDDEPLHVL
jgi:hypothetical protein